MAAEEREASAGSPRPAGPRGAPVRAGPVKEVQQRREQKKLLEGVTSEDFLPLMTESPYVQGVRGVSTKTRAGRIAVGPFTLETKKAFRNQQGTATR